MRIAALYGYDPATQRSAEALDRVVLHPAVEFPLDPEEVEDAAEALARPDDDGADTDADTPAELPAPALPVPPRLVPLFDYLPDAAVVLDDEVEERWHAFREQVEDGFAATGKVRRTGPSGGVLPRPNRLYLTPEQARRAVAARRLDADAPGIPVEPPRRVDALLGLARAALERGDRVVVATPEAPERVAAAARAAPLIEPSRPAYDRLARRFAYALSPDQRAAIEVVLSDLAAGRPMNRLVCGDVGFGKTEVALRAAAAVALAGWQVAIVAPTTVLARQHLDTVRRRFAGTGLRVAGLIRGADTPEGRAVRRGLADGDVRVVVGTHGIASEAVRFARLGLVVSDEEQRFGEAHKARLSGLTGTGAERGGNKRARSKRARNKRGGAEAAHVLTMTVTPIPRTLQGALVGLRDVSVIATAPVRRQPTRTFVLPFDPVVAREALMREHRRGGQSFVVCPRIGDLAPMQARLREVVPELRVVQAHGRTSRAAGSGAGSGGGRCIS